MPKKKKAKEFKAGDPMRILLGPRVHQTDRVKAVRRTVNNNPIYLLEGDDEPLGYLRGSLASEKAVQEAEAAEAKAAFQDYGGEHGTA